MAVRKKQARTALTAAQRMDALEHQVGRLADDFNATKRSIDQALDHIDAVKAQHQGMLDRMDRLVNCVEKIQQWMELGPALSPKEPATRTKRRTR